MTFAFDGVGKTVLPIDARNWPTTYTLDQLNRSIKNDSVQLSTYGYNTASELTPLTPQTGQPTTSAYDANGNPLTENTGGQVATYGWDGAIRVTRNSYSFGNPCDPRVTYPRELSEGCQGQDCCDVERWCNGWDLDEFTKCYCDCPGPGD